MGMIAGMVFASAAMVQRAPAGTLDQQLREQYPAGTVFVVKMKGIFAVTGLCPVAPAAAFKDGKLHRLGLFQATAAASSQCASRMVPVGSSLTLVGTLVEPKFHRVDLGLTDPMDGYKAQLWFEFAKGTLPTTDLKTVQDMIGQVFDIQQAQQQQQAQPQPQAQPQQQTPPQQQAPPAAPSLGPIYVNSQIATDRLQLNPGGSFSLIEGGQAFQGTYSINGNILRLHIAQLNKDVDITIDGDKLIVNGSETWEQPK
jgi:hypothetical protein